MTENLNKLAHVVFLEELTAIRMIMFWSQIDEKLSLRMYGSMNREK